jgi:hypothetical protein
MPTTKGYDLMDDGDDELAVTALLQCAVGSGRRRRVSGSIG